MSSPESNQPTESGALQLEVVQPSNSGDAIAPPSPTLSPDQLREVLAHMESSLRILREEIKEGVEQIAPHVTDVDSFVTGLCHISKEASSLSSWLLSAQLSIRLNQTLKQ
jgi:hypothetical protein